MFKISKFALNNLLKKKLSSVLLVLFLSFGFSILLFLEIGKSYLENLTNTVYGTNIGENKLIIEKESSSLGNIFNNIVDNTPSFNDSEIEQIDKLEGIKNVYKSSRFTEPAKMSIDLLGSSFVTDVFFEGIEEEVFKEKFNNFEDNQDYIPLVVSDKIVNSLIAIFVKDRNASSITKNLILGKEFDITFGKSTLTGNNNKSIIRKGKIVGFGEASSFMLVSIPLLSLEKVNKSLGIRETLVEKLFLEINPKTDIDSLQLQIEEMGFSVINPEKEKDKIKSVVNILYKIGLLIVSIFIATITYSLISFLILRIIESKKDNSIMFALGVTRSTIVKIYIIEGFIISLFGLLLSIGLTYLSLYFINSFVSSYNSTHNFINLLSIDFEAKNLISLIIFFVIINIISISFSCFKIWRSDWRKDV